MFTTSIEGPNAGHLNAEERYKQESGLFLFFVNATSSIEAFYYGFYLIGSILKPSKFPAMEANNLRLYPKDVVKRYKAGFTGDKFTVKLEQCISSKEFLSLIEYRDMYIHRGALPRHHQGYIVNNIVDVSKVYRTSIPGNPKDLPGQWRPGMDLNATTTRSRRDWLAQQIASLLDAGDVFCTAQFKADHGPVTPASC